jgi:raffinose/stachyose/melibiose transport system substrate-binding protein
MLVFASTLSAGAKDKIALKLADNISDRSQGWGAVFEKINQDFLKNHPGVDIETESYPDQPYQQKMKIYATSGQLPDAFKYWSFSTLLKPLVDEGMVMKLNMKDFQDKNFMAGALESNVWEGKLYGIPLSGDLWVIYYNKALFERFGVTVPTTFDELFQVAEVFKKNGIIPISSDGKDSWPFSIMFDNLVGRYAGDFSYPQQALDRKMKFTDPAFVKAAEMLQKMVKKGLFQADVVTSDYGAARNLFGQGAAAMYMMGSWELGLATDDNFSEEFRKNVRAFKIPVVKEGKGQIDDLFAWFGGNYVINSQTKHPELVLEYIKYLSEHLAPLTWAKQASFPAQKVQAGENDTELAKDLLRIGAQAKATSGPACLDRSTPQFKEDNQKFIQELIAGLITPKEFTEKLDKAAIKSSNK